MEKCLSEFMMTSSNGNIFRVIGPLCGEFTALRWIPLIKASNAELNKRLSKQSWGWWFETPSSSLWRHCNRSAKEMYYIFMFSWELQLKPIQYWKYKYPEENTNFDKWLKVMHMDKLCQRKSLDFNWRIFHGHINTEIILEKMRLSDGFCKLCNIEKENVDHILVHCKESASVWHKIQQLVNIIGEVIRCHIFIKLLIIYMTVNCLMLWIWCLAYVDGQFGRDAAFTHMQVYI